MKIIAEIEPLPLARPRFNSKTFGRYLPNRSKSFKYELAMLAKKQMAGRPLYVSPLSVSIHFYKLKPNPASKIYGDIDNLEKAVLDALNGVVWADDCLIVEIHSFKLTGNPRIEIFIEEAVI